MRIEARRLLVLGRSRCDSPQARVNMGPSKRDLFVPKHLGRASLDDLAGRQASWTRYRYPAVFGPVVTHLVTHRSVMAHTSRAYEGTRRAPRNGAVN